MTSHPFMRQMDDSTVSPFAGMVQEKKVGTPAMDTLMDRYPVIETVPYSKGEGRELDLRNYSAIKKPVTVEFPAKAMLTSLTPLILPPGEREYTLLGRHEEIIHEKVLMPIERGVSPRFEELAKPSATMTKGQSSWFSRGGLGFGDLTRAFDGRIWKAALVMMDLLSQILPGPLNSRYIELTPVPLLFMRLTVGKGVRVDLYDVEERVCRSSNPDREIEVAGDEMAEVMALILDSPWLLPVAVKEMVRALEDWKEFLLGVKAFRVTIATKISNKVQFGAEEVDPDKVLSRVDNDDVKKFSYLLGKMGNVLEMIELMLMIIKKKEIVTIKTASVEFVPKEEEKEKKEVRRDSVSGEKTRKTINVSTNNFKEILIRLN